MEGNSFGVSKIAIKDFTEATILGHKELCGEYSPLGIYEWTSEGVKDADLLGLIEIAMLGLTKFSNLEKIWVVRKMHHLMYFCNWLKVSLKVPCLELLKVLYNLFHLI